MGTWLFLLSTCTYRRSKLWDGFPSKGTKIIWTCAITLILHKHLLTPAHLLYSKREKKNSTQYGHPSDHQWTSVLLRTPSCSSTEKIMHKTEHAVTIQVLSCTSFSFTLVTMPESHCNPNSPAQPSSERTMKTLNENWSEKYPHFKEKVVPSPAELFPNCKTSSNPQVILLVSRI